MKTTQPKLFGVATEGIYIMKVKVVPSAGPTVVGHQNLLTLVSLKLVYNPPLLNLTGFLLFEFVSNLKKKKKPLQNIHFGGKTCLNKCTYNN